MKKEYFYIGVVAIVVIGISYFVLFSKSPVQNDSSSDDTGISNSSSDDGSNGRELLTGENKGKIYYPSTGKEKFSENKMNATGSPGKKDINNQTVQKSGFANTGVKGGMLEGTAGNIKGDVNSKMEIGGNMSGRVLLEESLFHEGTRVLLEGETGNFTAKTNEKGEFAFMMIPTGKYSLAAKADEYKSYSKGEIIVGRNANIKLSDIVLKPDFDIAYPRVIRTKPERGGAVVGVPNNFGLAGLDDTKTAIYLVFDFSKPMNKESVEKSVKITPLLRKAVLWAGNKRLILKCDSLASENPLKSNTEYTVEFTESALAIDGKKLAKMQPLIFKTAGLEYTGSSPINGAKNYPPSGKNMEFYFNFPIDKASAISENLIILPDTKGRLTVNDSRENQIYFRTDKFLPTGTPFVITIKKDLKDEYGNMLSKDVSLSFTTEPLKVMTVWPKDGEKNIQTSGFPYVFFNTNVKKETVEKALTIKPEVTGELVWKIDDTNIEYCVLKHKTFFNVSTEYLINISSDVSDLFGQKLVEPYKFLFKTESCRVSYMQPPEGSMNVDSKSEIKIIFNTMMNHEETEKYISIEPKTDVVFHWSSPDNYDILSIENKNGWKPFSNYTFRVAKAAKGKNGESLTGDFKGVIYTK